MRALSSVPNVDAPSGNYPNGRVRDKAGSTPGTTGGELLFGDLVQLLQKLIIDASITPNGDPDNVSNGYELLDALNAKIEETVKAEVTAGLICKIIDVENWNMYVTGGGTGTTNRLESHGLTLSKIKTCQVLVINDDGNLKWDIRGNNLSSAPQGFFSLTATDVNMTIVSGGLFDSTSYNDDTIQRAQIVLWYTP